MNATETAPVSAPVVAAPESAPAAAPDGTQTVPTPQVPTPARSAVDLLKSRPGRTKPGGQAPGAPAPAAAPGAAVPKAPAGAKVAPVDAKVDAQGRAHAEDGKYLPGAAERPAEAGEAGGQAVTDGESVPEGMVRLEVPEGNPLYARRRSIVVPAGDADTYRGLLKQGVEQSSTREHLTRLARERDEIRAQLARKEAEAAFYKEHGGSLWTLEDQALYDDIVSSYTETLGADVAKARAEAFKRGRMAEAETRVEEVAARADRETETARVQMDAQQFSQLAVADAASRYPYWTREEVARALQSFGGYIEARWRAGDEVPLHASAWHAFADSLYAQHPRAREDLRRSAEERVRQELRQEFEQKERERLEAAARGRAANPLGQLSHAQTMTSPSAERAGPPASVKELLQRVRDRSRGGR